MPHEAQPVPPIFQPEIIADAIHHAVHHPRLAFCVGWPTVKAVLGQKLVAAITGRIGATAITALAAAALAGALAIALRLVRGRPRL